jgi:large subunit ribosomal protein L16
VVKPGRVMFEVGGTGKAAALEALKLASHKLPIRTKISIRPDYEGA